MRFHLGGLAGLGAVIRSGDCRALGYEPGVFGCRPQTDGRARSGRPSGPAQVCAQAGTYLTAVRTGEHSGSDRVVFQFSGRLPGYAVGRVQAVDR